MPELKVRCPNCKTIIYTGFGMDGKSFLASTLAGSCCRCSKCGTKVVWDKNNVILE